MAGGVLYILLRAAGSSLLAAPSANLAGGGTLVAVTIWVWLMGAVDDVLFVCETAAAAAGAGVFVAGALAAGVSAAGALVAEASSEPPQAAKTKAKRSAVTSKSQWTLRTERVEIDWKFKRVSLGNSF